MDLDSIYVLESIKKFFGCGRIYIVKKDHACNYVVSSRKDFKNIIIPHFLNFPLFCDKFRSFNLMKIFIEGLFANKEKNKEGLIELVKIVLSMNHFTSRKEERIEKIKTVIGLNSNEIGNFFPNTISTVNTIITDDNIAGVIDGDGSFWVSFSLKGKIKLGFSITADNNSIHLLNLIRSRFLGIGSIQKKK